MLKAVIRRDESLTIEKTRRQLSNDVKSAVSNLGLRLSTLVMVLSCLDLGIREGGFGVPPWPSWVRKLPLSLVDIPAGNLLERTILGWSINLLS